VLFDDATEPSRLTEPLATAGWLRAADDSPGTKGEFQFPFYRIVLQTDRDQIGNGQWLTMKANQVLQSNFYQVESAEAIAYPLLSSQDELSLDTLLVAPSKQKLSAEGNHESIFSR